MSCSFRGFVQPYGEAANASEFLPLHTYPALKIPTVYIPHVCLQWFDKYSLIKQSFVWKLQSGILQDYTNDLPAMFFAALDYSINLFSQCIIDDYFNWPLSYPNFKLIFPTTVQFSIRPALEYNPIVMEAVVANLLANFERHSFDFAHELINSCKLIPDMTKLCAIYCSLDIKAACFWVQNPMFFCETPKTQDTRKVVVFNADIKKSFDDHLDVNKVMTLCRDKPEKVNRQEVYKQKVDEGDKKQIDEKVSDEEHHGEEKVCELKDETDSSKQYTQISKESKTNISFEKKITNQEITNDLESNLNETSKQKVGVIQKSAVLLDCKHTQQPIEERSFLEQNQQSKKPLIEQTFHPAVKTRPTLNKNVNVKKSPICKTDKKPPLVPIPLRPQDHARLVSVGQIHVVLPEEAHMRLKHASQSKTKRTNKRPKNKRKQSIPDKKAPHVPLDWDTEFLEIQDTRLSTDFEKKTCEVVPEKGNSAKSPHIKPRSADFASTKERLQEIIRQRKSIIRCELTLRLPAFWRFQHDPITFVELKTMFEKSIGREQDAALIQEQYDEFEETVQAIVQDKNPSSSVLSKTPNSSIADGKSPKEMKIPLSFKPQPGVKEKAITGVALSLYISFVSRYVRMSFFEFPQSIHFWQRNLVLIYLPEMHLIYPRSIMLCSLLLHCFLLSTKALQLIPKILSGVVEETEYAESVLKFCVEITQSRAKWDSHRKQWCIQAKKVEELLVTITKLLQEANKLMGGLVTSKKHQSYYPGEESKWFEKVSVALCQAGFTIIYWTIIFREIKSFMEKSKLDIIFDSWHKCVVLNLLPTQTANINKENRFYSAFWLLPTTLLEKHSKCAQRNTKSKAHSLFESCDCKIINLQFKDGSKFSGDMRTVCEIALESLNQTQMEHWKQLDKVYTALHLFPNPHRELDSDLLLSCD